MAGRSHRLGQSVLARLAAPRRAGGQRLAQNVVAARTPERIVETSTRLAQGRSIGRAPAAAPVQESIPRPPGMSEFAARWIFGDGQPEGIPIAGEAALASMTSGRPKFLEEQDAREAKIAEAQAAHRSQPVLRGQVDEVPAGFRLARKPIERPVATPPPPPAPMPTTERIVEEVRPRGTPPLPPRAPEPAVAPTPQASETPNVPAQSAAAQSAAAQGAAIQGAAIQSAAAQGSAIQGSAIQGSAIQGAATQGAATQGAATQGSTVESTAVHATGQRAGEGALPPAGPPAAEPPAPAGAAPPSPPSPSADLTASEPALEQPARPKLTVSRSADASPRRAVRAQRVDRAPELPATPAEPAPAEPASVTPTPAPAAAPRGIFRRALDSVLRRDPPAPVAQPSVPAVQQSDAAAAPASVSAAAASGPARSGAPSVSRVVAAPTVESPGEALRSEPAQPARGRSGVDRAAAGRPLGRDVDDSSAEPSDTPAPAAATGPLGSAPATAARAVEATQSDAAEEPADDETAGGSDPGEVLRSPVPLELRDAPPADERSSLPRMERAASTTAGAAGMSPAASESPVESSSSTSGHTASSPAGSPPQASVSPASERQTAAVARVPLAVSRTEQPPARQGLFRKLFGRGSETSEPSTPAAASPGRQPGVAAPAPIARSSAGPTGQPSEPGATAGPTLARAIDPGPATLVQRVREASAEPIQAAPAGTAARAVPETPHARAAAPQTGQTSVYETAQLRAATTTRAASTVPAARRAAAQRPTAQSSLASQERPPLRLVSAPAHASAPAGIARSIDPGPAASGPVRATRTSGSRLAEATGGRVTQEPGGVETVFFPSPPGMQAAVANGLYRAEDSSNDSANSNATASPPPAAAPAPAPAAPQGGGGGGGGGGGDIEEIYDQVIERLRRDLLADRERMGDVLGDLP